MVSSLVTDGLVLMGRAQTLGALHVVADGFLPALPDVTDELFSLGRADGLFPLGRAYGLFPLGRAREDSLLVVAVDEV